MNGNMCPFTIIHDRCTDLYGYFRNACVTSQEHVALPVNLVELRCQSGASELTCVGVGAGLMDELFDFLIVKMVGGIFTLAFRIAWFLPASSGGSWDAPITQAPPAQQIAAPPSAGSARVVQDGSR